MGERLNLHCVHVLGLDGSEFKDDELVDLAKKMLRKHTNSDMDISAAFGQVYSKNNGQERSGTIRKTRTLVQKDLL